MKVRTEALIKVEDHILAGLKDFQRATVDRVDALYRKGQHRVLISDEVGLGKTLVARGVVAKMARLHKEERDKLFKVVYVCANGAIADQNIQKLRIIEEAKLESVASSRLSMQHLNLFNQEYDEDLRRRFIQLIPLTPDTSFRVTIGPGMVGERALMFALLRRLPGLANYAAELEVMMQGNASGSWKDNRDRYEEEAVSCDQKTGGKYFRYMLKRLSAEMQKPWSEGLTYLSAVRNHCKRIRAGRPKDPENTRIIGQLRIIFARISLEKLKPDLVIMDEFQRFRDLIDVQPDSDTGMLTDKFFHSKNVRMLLLSATPYKMYSTPEEIDEMHMDEHFHEFLKMMEFLNEGEDAEQRFRTVWRNYTVQLREMSVGDTSILSAKKAAENAMYETVCRTERISERNSGDLIDDADVHHSLSVMEQDIRSYMQAQELLDAIGLKIHVPVDYIKSTPYLMSFMRDYQLKRDVERYFRQHPDEIKKIKKDTFWLNERAIDHYEKIPNNNARLDRVMNCVLQKNAEKLLWIPPSKPYYELQGVFKDARNTTKTLIFSSWEMVPRMLASLISYEAERKTVGSLALHYQGKDAHYFSIGEKRYPTPRLNFTVKNDAPAAMTLFCLIYPSTFLAECYDPIACMNSGLGLREIKK